MRKSILGLSAVLFATVAAMPAFAQDAAPSAFTINGGATVVSDYRFRGVSQTDKRFAVQGSLTVTHSSGLYVSVWGSSIDDYVANSGDQEIDLIGGYSKTIGSVTLDGGVLYYYYPGSGGANTDFVEPYFDISSTFGPVKAKATVNYAPKQKALTVDGIHKEDNLYIAGDFSAAVPSTPISLTAHIGHTFGPSYLVPSGKEYTDWGVGASIAYKQLTFGVNYVDTDKDCYFSATNPTRNQCKAGVVGSVGVAF